MRDAFLCMILPWLLPGGQGDGVSKWIANVRITQCIKCFQRAETDPDIKGRVLNDGIWKAAGVM